MERSGAVLAWCTTKAVRLELENARLPFSVEWTTPKNPFGAGTAVVLDTRAFSDIRSLVETRRERPTFPVLVVCALKEIEELSQALQDIDDLTLHDAPPSLLLFRLGRLVNAACDSHTGLVQRSVFIEILQQAVEDPSRMPLSLLLVDLDRFKAVNDKYGHHLGDTVIRETASRIARVTSRNAVVARTGGGVYGILDTLSVSDAVALAKKTREAVSATPIRGVDVTVSIGCATAAVPGQPLYKPADEALHAAKAKGRDCVVHHDEMARRARERHREVDLEDFENRTRVIAEHVVELITRRGRKLFEQLKEQADFDGLTGVFSRRYLDRRLAFEVEVSTERQNPLTVALLDIDHFGKVNKKHGWPTGDKVLTEVADRIRNNTRDDDWVARYGGEEFCIVMYATPLETAPPVLERIRSAVSRQPFTTTAGRKMEITASIGAAQREPGDDDVHTLMERVSHQLLRAKRGGRNRVVT